MEDNIIEAFEVVVKRVVTGIVKILNGDAFTVGYDEKKKGIKTLIKNMVERVLNNSVEQVCLSTPLVCSVDALGKCPHFMDALKR